MTIDSIIILISMATGLVGVYVALSNKIVGMETKINHLEADLERERMERKGDNEEVRKFHHNQTKAWHELALSIESLKGVLQGFQKEVKPVTRKRNVAVD